MPSSKKKRLATLRPSKFQASNPKGQPGTNLEALFLEQGVSAISILTHAGSGLPCTCECDCGCASGCSSCAGSASEHPQ